MSHDHMTCFLKSPASRMIVQWLVQAKCKEYMEAPHCWPFMKGTWWWPLDSPHKVFWVVGKVIVDLFIAFWYYLLPITYQNWYPFHYENYTSLFSCLLSSLSNGNWVNRQRPRVWKFVNPFIKGFRSHCASASSVNTQIKRPTYIDNRLVT